MARNRSTSTLSVKIGWRRFPRAVAWKNPPATWTRSGRAIGRPRYRRARRSNGGAPKSLRFRAPLATCPGVRPSDMTCRDMAWGQALGHGAEGQGRLGDVGALRFGPAGIPSRDSPDVAVEALLERGYTA